MEIEVGEWARTVDGIIGMIEQYENGEYWIRHSDIDVWKCAIDSIIKHSKKLIDLIEVGDFVNGSRVEDRYLLNGEKPVLETAGTEKNSLCLCERDIREGLTHEQYEANCFKRAEVENERDKIQRKRLQQ